MYVVTGGAGFIGSNIVKALNDRGITEVLVVDDLTQGDRFGNLVDCRIADFMDRAEFRRALAAGDLDGHLTAISHQGACADTTESDGRYMMDNNYTFSKELFHKAIEQGVPFVYASSAAVYGASTEFREDPAHERPLNVYGYSKLLFDQYVRRNVHRAHSTVVGLRYFNVYGPREQFKGRMASMPYQLYRQIRDTGVAKLFQGTDGYGDGEQERDFVYVGDVVAVNLHFLHASKPIAGIFNTGSGVSRSFNDIARTLISQLGRGSIQYVPFPASLAGKYQSFTRGDIHSLRRAGYTTPTTTLEVGLAACVEKWDQQAAAPQAPAKQQATRAS